MAKTFLVFSTRLENDAVRDVTKDVRNEISRSRREGLRFEEFSPEQHEFHLRQYRRRKNLLMPPFSHHAKRTFWAVFSQDGTYCCSTALFEHNGALRIQGVSIASGAPYFAFSFLMYCCLQKAARDGFRALDLAGLGAWKEKWAPVVEEDGFVESPSRFGGRITPVLARIYWATEGNKDPISRRVHGFLKKNFG